MLIDTTSLRQISPMAMGIAKTSPAVRGARKDQAGREPAHTTGPEPFTHGQRNSVNSHLEVSRRNRQISGSSRDERVRKSIGRVKQCPGIRSRAGIELPLPPATALVPTALIRRPIAHTDRAGPRTVRQCPVPHADSSCSIERRCGAGLVQLAEIIHVKVPILYRPGHCRISHRQSRRKRLPGGQGRRRRV